MKNTHTVRPEIRRYVEGEIIPRYDSFDKGHDCSHAEDVIADSLKLAERFDADPEMAYVIAAYHDLGLCEGRELHHIVSGRILLGDPTLKKWFDDDSLRVMSEAVEDHRASSGHAPRSIYGMIVADADRRIDTSTILRRTVQYGMKHYPEYGPEEHWNRFIGHLEKKYGDGGYMRFWIPDSDNARRLAELRAAIRDREALRRMFDRIYAEENVTRAE